MRRFYPLIILLQVLFLFGCEEETPKEPEPVTEKVVLESIDLYSPWIDSVYQSLSLQDKVGQLIWTELPQLNDSVLKIFNNLPMGAIISHDEKKGWFSLQSLQDSSKAPILQGTDQWYLPYTFEKNHWDNNEFYSVSNAELLKEINDSTCYYHNDLGIKILLESYDSSSLSYANQIPKYQPWYDSLTQQLNNHQILYSATINKNDSSAGFQKRLNEENKIVLNFSSDTSSQHLREDQLLINGIQLANNHNIYDSVVLLLKEQTDLILLKKVFARDLFELQQRIESAVTLNAISEAEVEFKVRKVLALKEWLGLNKQEFISEQEFDKKHLISLRSNAYRIKYNSEILIRNKGNYLPIKDWNTEHFSWVRIGKNNMSNWYKSARNYADIQPSKSSLKGLNLDRYKKSTPVIIALHERLDKESAEVFRDKINLYSSRNKIVVINFEHEENLPLIDSIPYLLHVWNTDKHSLQQAAQAIFGGNEISGVLPYSIQHLDSLYGLHTSKTRLSYPIPEEGGFHRDSLKNVDRIARNSIYGGVTPGCQVFAARGGKVVYNRSFGHHTYDKMTMVENSHVYDLASVTKVASTTICGMQMYDRGLYNISDSMWQHLPDSLTRVLGHRSRLWKVTFQQLYTHTSGLPAGLPIYKYIAYVDSLIGKFDRYYCDETDGYYCVEVAKDFYLDSAYLDTLWLAMNNIWTGTKKYKYSDANLNVLYQIFRAKLRPEISFDQYMDSVFYSRMKLRTTTFLPLENLDTLKHPITPTEFDTYWRYQLLKGHVHDPNAALYGGVAGNAGLFSNAHDLGVVFQMLMNDGSYGGIRYIKPATVKRFTRHQEGSHRGLGFDKPTGKSTNTVAPDCPTTAYGHTGFTGICAWADPENDLLFVFASNRVHPDPNNKKIVSFGTRKRLHQAFYDQLKHAGEYKNSSKNLP